MRIIRTLITALLPSIAMAANPQLGFNELQQNQAQPHITINSADRAITQALAGQLTINFSTNANYTLSGSQWQWATIRMTDTGPVLSTGRDVIYPNVDSQTGGTSRASFYFVNGTAQTLTVKRSGQTGVAVPAGTAALLHHNGTDVEAISAGGGGGPVDLTSGVTGVLPHANGGTDVSTSPDDQTLVGNGTAFQLKSLPTCTDSGGNHLNYDPSSNSFSCGTSSSVSGGAPTTATYVTQTPDAGLSNEQALSALTTGIVKNTTTTGVLSIAAEGTDYYGPGGTDVAFSDGGTGLGTAADDTTLVSTGSAWQAKTIPNCTDTGGNHLNYTQSTNAFSCGTSASGGGGGTPGGSTTQVQYNNAGAFAGDANFTWSSANRTLGLGATAAQGVIAGNAVASTATGTNLAVRAGTGGSTSGAGGTLDLEGGSSPAGIGGNVNVKGGANTTFGQNAGSASVSGGDSFGGIAGDLTISAGAGTGGGSNGQLRINAAGGTSVRIDEAGGWRWQNTAASADGLAVISSGGSSIPTWGALGAAGGGTGLTAATQGDLLYSSATNTWARLAKNTTASRYLSNQGTSNNPSWMQVNLSNGVSGTLPIGNRRINVRTVTAAGAIATNTADEIICVNKTTGAATAVNLHATPASGTPMVIKDCKGDAATNNITITPAAGNIDGAANFVINTNYGSVSLFHNGTQWFIEAVR